MTEGERSPLVRNENGYGSTKSHSNSVQSIEGVSDIQVDNRGNETAAAEGGGDGGDGGGGGSGGPSTSTESDRIEQMRSTLPSMSKAGFGLGHVYNDLCAGVWFSYTLLFLQGALLVPGAEAGALMMIGQVGDALATPIVGYLADRYGTKRKWHVFGKRNPKYAL